MPELTYDEMQELLGTRAAARGLAEADDYWAKHDRECKAEADRLAVVRQCSSKALYDIALAVIEAHGPDTLATVAGRERLAKHLVDVLSAL